MTVDEELIRLLGNFFVKHLVMDENVFCYVGTLGVDGTYDKAIDGSLTVDDLSICTIDDCFNLKSVLESTIIDFMQHMDTMKEKESHG